MPWGIKSLPLSFFLTGKRKKKNRELSVECGCFRLWALDRLPGKWQVDSQTSLCPESGRWLQGDDCIGGSVPVREERECAFEREVQRCRWKYA